MLITSLDELQAAITAERMWQHIFKHHLLTQWTTVPTFKFAELKEGTTGSTNDADRSITIDLEQVKTVEQLKETVIHELIHLDQLISGDLVIDHINGVYLWKNIPIDFEDFVYDEAPWEIDADLRTDLIMDVLTRVPD